MMISRMKRLAAMAALSVALALFGVGARADESGDANAILKAMSDYVTSQKSITAAFNTDIEAVTPELQKIQFASSGEVQLIRPDKLHASRTGGYTGVELFFDGKTFALEDKKVNVYAQSEAPGSVDQLIDKLRGQLGVDMPGAQIRHHEQSGDEWSPIHAAYHQLEDQCADRGGRFRASCSGGRQEGRIQGPVGHRRSSPGDRQRRQKMTNVTSRTLQAT